MPETALQAPIDWTDEFLLKPETWDRVRDLWWVCDFPPGYYERGPIWDDWRWSVDPPPPVPNTRMSWRHPTYEEAVERQRIFIYDRQRYDREMQRVQINRERRGR